MHHKISLSVSPHQIRRLRKGLSTRVKKGTGFNLLVHPETYHLMSRAFNSNKGIQIKLNKDEMDLNRKNAPIEEDEVSLNSDAEDGEDMEMPEPKGTGLRRKCKGKGLLTKRVHRSLSPLMSQPKVTGLTRKIGRSVAESNRQLASMSNNAIDQRIKKAYPTYQQLSQEPFAPFSRGYGLNSSHSIVGRGGNMLAHGFGLPPALQSQPFSANFQMSHFLPPHYQHYNNTMDGHGLYAGRGLYA